MKALDFLAQSFESLIKVSWQASVLVALVLLIQSLFRSKLSSGWRYALWMIVLLRLMLPFSPKSPVSLFNYAKPPEPVSSGLAAFSETVFKSPGFISDESSAISTPLPIWTMPRVLGRDIVKCCG